jgi:hypothetical protein
MVGEEAVGDARPSPYCRVLSVAPGTGEACLACE